MLPKAVALKVIFANGKLPETPRPGIPTLPENST